MAINQNRNSIRVLRTAGGSYLAHKNIPNFSIGTGSDFTIQLWVVTGGDMDGVLYSQEGGFSIQLVDGQVVFSLDGFATLRPEDGWVLASHARSYIAVRYQAGTLTLFLGGLPAAEQTVSAKAVPCTGDYAIGKHFTGGFPLIRVSDTARSDRDILADNAAPPPVDGHCVFQSDCSTAQYRDVSANRLPMWAEGREAGCGIYTACTLFSGKGQVSCTPLESLNAAHTLLLKLRPQPQQRPVQRVYTAMDGAETLYAVELTAQDDNTFRLSLVSGGGDRATLSKPLLPELWQDVAAVFDGGKVKLYLDGAPDGGSSFSFSGKRSDILVGAEYETGRPIYEKAFTGYMAYTAEFNKALSAADVALYADDPPFLFEDGLVSLLPLDWPDGVEGVGATPLRVTGSAPFIMAPDITPRDGDIGCSMRVPTEVSPYWKTLSADEQWALELLASLFQEELTGLCGYAKTAEASTDIPLIQRIAKPFSRHHRQGWVRLQKLSPSKFDGKTATKYIAVDLSGPANAPLAGALGAGALTGAAAGGVTGFVSANAGVIAGTAVALTVAALLVAAFIAAERDRPSSDGDLKVTGICWNHRGDPARGGLHYHNGGADLPASMTDTPVPGAAQLDTLCVLVPSRLATPTVDVTLTYTTAKTTPKSGTLKGCDIPPDALLGEHTAAYTVAPNASVTVSLAFDAARFPRDRVKKLQHTWELWDGDTHLTNCKCTFYLLPDVPIDPWDIQSGDDYDPDEPAYPRLEFLDFFTPAQNQNVDFAAWAVQRLNTSGFVYDVLGGGLNHYCDFYWNVFYLARFLRDLGQPNKVLNCADCAHIVSTACALVGKDLPMATFISPANQGFDCNRIIAIGTADWRYPFDATGTETRGGFGYHMFNAGDANLTKDTPIYDACLKVDGGDYPGDGGPAGARKIEALPAGMPARDGDANQVNVPLDVPYAKNCYRERLVHDGESCNFERNVKYVTGIDVVSAARAVSPSPLIAAAMDAFGLAPTPEEAADFAARPRGDWTPEALPGAALTWSGPDHDRWSLMTENRPCRVRHWRCDTAEEASWRMAAQVAAYTHPDKRPGRDLGAEVGERCVVVGGRQIVFCRLGNVFTVNAGTLEAALAAAKALDESVLAG